MSPEMYRLLLLARLANCSIEMADCEGIEDLAREAIKKGWLTVRQASIREPPTWLSLSPAGTAALLGEEKLRVYRHYREKPLGFGAVEEKILKK
jgi:hypothetical protein